MYHVSVEYHVSDSAAGGSLKLDYKSKSYKSAKLDDLFDDDDDYSYTRQGAGDGVFYGHSLRLEPSLLRSSVFLPLTLLLMPLCWSTG